ncbi:hypothetical protein H0H93_002204 [Arthromyces matolae]|nr:hypothetical protein H0H93_002204 [Arthromyces matolae]
MKFARLATVAAVAASAAADFTIYSPSTDVWWVQKSINTLSWNCKDNAALAAATFTVLVGNTDPKVLTSPIAIISIENNFDCSKTITADQLSAAPGTGYFVAFANTLNQSDIYTQSSPFEIKALGSAYPTATPGIAGASSTSGSSAANSTSSASGSAATSTKPNGAASVAIKAAGVLGAVAGVLSMVL